MINACRVQIILASYPCNCNARDGAMRRAFRRPRLCVHKCDIPATNYFPCAATKPHLSRVDGHPTRPNIALSAGVGIGLRTPGKFDLHGHTRKRRRGHATYATALHA